MEKFSEGDQVKLIGGKEFIGEQATILSIADEKYNRTFRTNEPFYNIKINGTGVIGVAKERLLEKIAGPLADFEKLLYKSEHGLDGNIPYTSEDYLAEMATIAATNKLNISVVPERNRLGIAYFKVYDNGNLNDAKGVARLHFKDSGIEIHNSDPLNKKPWIPNSRTIKDIRNLVSQPDPRSDNIYIIWQVLCYEWDRVNGLIPWNATMREYTSGKCDNQKFNDTRLESAFVPSTTEIPDTWEYNPLK